VSQDGPAESERIVEFAMHRHVFVYHPDEKTPQLPVAATFAIGSDNRAA
jgi:hypothetical protein